MNSIGSKKIVFDRYSRQFSLIFAVFYAVGIAGLLVPQTFPYFIKLFPFALLLSFAGLIAFHGSKFTVRTILVFAFVFIISFAIEAIGVKTGIIFGEYSYGSTLGLKLFETPLIIGLNWILLVYLTASIFQQTNLPEGIKVLFASLTMLIYDVVMEPVASLLDMWHWKNDVIPHRNYLAWFVLALFFHIILKISGVRTNNRLALVLFLCQFGFFLAIWFNYKVLQ